MAWGLEARVPFLDKKFLEVAMSIDPKEKMFNKGASQQIDEDGCPRMEKVPLPCSTAYTQSPDTVHSTSSGKPSIAHRTARLVALVMHQDNCR